MTDHHHPAAQAAPSLLGCPFCGSNDIHIFNDGDFLDQGWTAYCYICGAKSTNCASNEEAQKHWNTRAASPSIPEGYCIVPIEPTEAMFDAGYKAAAFPRDPEICAAMYKAMIAAAAPPPQSRSNA